MGVQKVKPRRHGMPVVRQVELKVGVVVKIDNRRQGVCKFMIHDPSSDSCGMNFTRVESVDVSSLFQPGGKIVCFGDKVSQRWFRFVSVRI